MLPALYRSEIDIRNRQINTLKIFNDNVKEVQEGSEYQVLFKASNNEFCLHVRLTPEFPNDKPILQISPVVVHPWVNTDGDITSAPGLLNFTIHSDLGRVVQAIIREFARNPPPLTTDQSVTTPSGPNLGHEPDTMGRSSPIYTYNYSNIQHAISQSMTFPELNTLNLEELQFMNECVEQQEEFVDNLPQMKEMNKGIDDLISNIEELADSNLSKREHFERLNKEIEAKVDLVSKLAYENERLNSVYQSLSEKYSPKNIKEQLREAAEVSNIDSERVAEAFLNGDLDVDKFVTSYTQIRSLNQARKTKEEKLSQQLRNLEKAGF
ncbi:hypothetical protein RI129_005349 [Pyrocoelia pectoralis]|uniref:VPS37 C-terminal domain-containing protein n=1 Tax=Pyrocoelia pectoralis TaxID=417401 RepID=A0AAN7VE11_9COLE